jgi:hypothetical protein
MKVVWFNGWCVLDYGRVAAVAPVLPSPACYAAIHLVTWLFTALLLRYVVTRLCCFCCAFTAYHARGSGMVVLHLAHFAHFLFTPRLPPYVCVAGAARRGFLFRRVAGAVPSTFALLACALRFHVTCASRFAPRVSAAISGSVVSNAYAHARTCAYRRTLRAAFHLVPFRHVCVCWTQHSRHCLAPQRLCFCLSCTRHHIVRVNLDGWFIVGVRICDGTRLLPRAPRSVHAHFFSAYPRRHFLHLAARHPAFARWLRGSGCRALRTHTPIVGSRCALPWTRCAPPFLPVLPPRALPSLPLHRTCAGPSFSDTSTTIRAGGLHGDGRTRRGAHIWTSFTTRGTLYRCAYSRAFGSLLGRVFAPRRSTISVPTEYRALQRCRTALCAYRHYAHRIPFVPGRMHCASVLHTLFVSPFLRHVWFRQGRDVLSFSSFSRNTASRIDTAPPLQTQRISAAVPPHSLRSPLPILPRYACWPSSYRV